MKKIKFQFFLASSSLTIFSRFSRLISIQKRCLKSLNLNYTYLLTFGGLVINTKKKAKKKLIIESVLRNVVGWLVLALESSKDFGQILVFGTFSLLFFWRNPMANWATLSQIWEHISIPSFVPASLFVLGSKPLDV